MPKLSSLLTWLMLLCKPGKPCRLGKYVVSSYPKHVILRESVGEDSIMLAMASKIRKKHPISISFVINKVDLPEWYNYFSYIDTCHPGVCVDGINVKLGDYKRYVYESFALVLHDNGNAYIGTLFTHSLPKVSRLNRFRARIRLWRHNRRTRTRGGG